MKYFLVFAICLLAMVANGQQTKIDYQLTKPSDTGSLYSVVIKTVDPAKDDYKAWCRYIVSDVKSKTGINNLTINIFDIKQAQYLFDITSKRKGLPKADIDNIHAHHIAYYNGKTDDAAKSNKLVFYPGCSDTPLKKYMGKEDLKP